MSPDEKTCLIFEIDSSEGHSELINLAKSRGKVVRLAKEEARSLAQNYLQQKLARFKKTITPGARQRILEMCGDAIVFLDTMLDRILQYSGEAQLIDENMVCLFEENWRGVNVFQLADAILERDRGKARQTFHELLENSESEPRFLIGIIHWQLRQLWQGAVLREAGTSEAEILRRSKSRCLRKGLLCPRSTGTGWLDWKPLWRLCINSTEKQRQDWLTPSRGLKPGLWNLCRDRKLTFSRKAS